MQQFESHGACVFYSQNPGPFEISDTSKPLVIWAHGWGQSHASFLPLIQSLQNKANHIALDLPGFGKSPVPPEHWGTQDYADAVAGWLKAANAPPVIWVGHSFGCRVGVRLAARYPELVNSMVLIAGAGLKRKRPLPKKIYLYARIRLFKFLRKFVPDGDFKDRLMRAFGSTDYKNAGALRTIFIRTVNEDLSAVAKKIKSPVALIYGENDTETPPEFGERYSRLIPQSEFFLLERQDHYSVLSTGRHPVIKILSDALKKDTK